MSYKPTIRSQQQPPDQPQLENSKYRAQAKQLQELFPAWSNEVAGDVELAATRISEGHAEQWGSVTRKKEKKVSVSGQPKDAGFSLPRGGRGGRGGGRGGLSGRGSPATRGRGGPPRGAPNGHAGRSSTPRISSPAPHQPAASSASEVQPDGDAKDKGALDAQVAEPANGRASGAEAPSVNGASSSTWSAKQEAPDPTVHVNSAAASSHVLPKPTKTPATSKMSWAQIARSQEKPAPPPVPLAAPAPISAPAPVPPQPALAPESEAESLPPPVWEEPTTVQPPTWDDEPPSIPPAPEPASEEWNMSANDEPQSESTSAEPAQEPEPDAPQEPVQVAEPKPEPQAPKPQAPQPTPSALPAQILQQQLKDLQSSNVSAPPAVATPSPRPSQARPSSAAHRANAKFKIGDQPAVVMPSTFSGGVEKVGMQFGSLSLGGDASEAPASETQAPEPARVSEVSAPAPEPEPIPTPAPAPVAQAPEPPVQPTPAPPAPSAPTPTSISSSALFQQTLTQRQTPPQMPSSQSLATSVSQPIISSTSAAASHPSAPSAVASPAQQYPAQSIPQSSITHHLQQQQQHALPQQIQQQANAQQQHQYSQHGFSAHADPQPNQVQQQLPQSQHQQPQGAANAAAAAASHNTYFRGNADPFFHTPTPPAPQAQDSPYGAFGQQLGQQMQHSAQASHVGAFGAEYGYGESPRGFYDSYAQQSGFASRNPLGHDDMKALPGGQQQPAATVGLSASASQSAQHAASSQTAQPPAAAGQAPQQGYPPPLPYYYQPYPQNQYYSSPYNSGYGVPNYVKYPAMFASAPAPASAPSPATKQPGSVQPQSNPYGQGLYTQHQQHPSASYDDMGYQHHTQQHQPHSLGGGLPANDYNKPLYGGQGNFMGLGQSTGPSAGVRNTTGGSPEAAYKPYAPKDVNNGVGTGMGVGQGMQAGRASVQGQQPNQAGQSQGQGQPQQGQSGFYNVNRYGGNAAGVGGGVGGPQGQAAHHLHQPQGQGPQTHLGYPQGASDGSFYSYQPRQQGYWQQ
ncbi:hypothetical protein PC9H_011289 [Pleurotus ostreatus]|uniref:Uncharacterized protein n=1 Tax=Pleurotus ostreatus TaxID=5322 RepID=A0A8H6ZQ95_PLEOS|nr:uncharacterized protein PC9H_011289 [Pleurotus ostreatus]KAF7420771.1 hypothetical protein PC9H_011289 [Pleurotus ostreatus]